MTRLVDDRHEDAHLDDEVTEDERREAEALRALLQGDAAQPIPNPPATSSTAPSTGPLRDIAEVAGLLRHAGGVAAPDPWDRVRRNAPHLAQAIRGRRRSGWWAAASFAVAAGMAIVLWTTPLSAPPDGPTAAQLEQAVGAIHPDYGSMARRLDALNAVATSERRRRVAVGLE